MLKFRKLKKNAVGLKKYFEKARVEFCDVSVGVRFLWRDDFKIKYALLNDTLILRESTKDYKKAYYYPMGENVEDALKKIEKECKKTGKELTFCCLDEECEELIRKRFSNAQTSYNRDWSDYIYDAKEFKELVGKKYSGQRNHINKFKKNYPNFEYRHIKKTDLKQVKEFLKEYNAGKDFRYWTERDESRRLIEYIRNLDKLENVGAIVKVDGKIVALTCGERIKNTFIVHVEKALTKYSGIYPTIANLFANDVVGEDIKTINREEDCGDEGLRISKTQYHPKEIKNKYIVKIKVQ